MLILSRGVLEEIKIGNEITVSVVEVKGGKVRIGIEAPKHVNIMRREAVFGAGALPGDLDNFEKTDSKL